MHLCPFGFGPAHSALDRRVQPCKSVVYKQLTEMSGRWLRRMPGNSSGRRTKCFICVVWPAAFLQTLKRNPEKNFMHQACAE